MPTFFLPGIDVLSGANRKWIKGRRIGLVSHPAAVGSRGAPAVEILRNAGAKIRALFGPEHGFSGTETAGEKIGHKVHPELRIPVYSLYGATRRPTAGMLDGLDAIVLDLQDLGARCYTFGSTLRYCLEAAAPARKQVIVADRPIPLPRTVDGPLLDERFSSFVGCIPAPMHYGMTPGETALWLKHTKALDLDLKVAPMKNYRRQSRRGPDWPPWIPPSPGIRSWETGWCYLATVFGEALPAINIGRGSNLAFQVFSAPGVKSNALCKCLNGHKLPGVMFYPHPYKLTHTKRDNHIPSQSVGRTLRVSRAFKRLGRPFGLAQGGDASPYLLKILDDNAKIFDGVRISVHDPDIFLPVTTGLAIIAAAQEIKGASFIWRRKGTRAEFFDKLYGTDQVRLALQAGEPAAAISRDWQGAIRAFKSDRRLFLLYK